MEQQQLDSSENSGQSQIDKLPVEVDLTNTELVNTTSALTLSDEEISIVRKRITQQMHIAGQASFVVRFEVGIMSSRNRTNLERFIDFLMGDMKRKFLFFWAKYGLFPFTFALPQKAPFVFLYFPHTAIFSHSFKFNINDNSLGAGGDLRVYLERLASAENVQNFIVQNPFGQIAITERSHDWGFYSQVINSCVHSELQNNVGLPA
ncbi:hypothetical protein CRYUN_Cryun24cG0092700 [Craigia yunnanensis]